jgi:hypothetical protein
MHKTTPFDGPEIEGMMRAVDGQGVDSGELIWVSRGSDVRLFRAGQQPPLRGTLVDFEPNHASR